MRRSIVAGLMIASSNALAFPQSRQPSQLERFERQLEQSQRDQRVLIDPAIQPSDRALIDYGGYLSLSYFHIDDPAGSIHNLGQYEAAAYGRVNFDGAHELYARVNTVYQDFATGDSFDKRGDDWIQPRVERAHYRFDLQRALAAYGGKIVDDNVILQAGRQLVHWANGAALDEVVDGAVVTVSHDPFTLDVLAGVTFNKTIDFDVSRRDFRQDTDRGLFGAILTAKTGTHTPFLYGLVQRDYNGSETRTDSSGVTTEFDYDSVYLGIGSSGAVSDNLYYALEAVYETGSTLSNSTDPATFAQLDQTDDDIEAFALDGRLDYLFADPNRTRITGEMIVASGDRDRQVSNTTLGGNAPDTSDHGYNALGLLNTGLAFAPATSNLIVLRAGISTFPVPDSARFRQLQVGFDVLIFNKFLEQAPLDEATNDRRFLGVEGDLYLNWQLASDVTLALRYGGFLPGPAIETDSGLRNFFFAGVTYAF